MSSPVTGAGEVVEVVPGSVVLLVDVVVGIEVDVLVVLVVDVVVDVDVVVLFGEMQAVVDPVPPRLTPIE